MKENLHVKTKSINLVSGTPILKKQEILEYFLHTFDLYEDLFKCISNERGYFEKANPLRHPLIFYFAHTAVFFTNKLRVMKFIDQGIDPFIETTMAIGVDEMSWDDLNEDNYQWPSIQKVQNYRNQVRAMICELIESTELVLPITQDSLYWLIMMGIEHERIHLETSSVLIRELPLEYVESRSPWSKIATSKAEVPENQLLEVQAGPINLGVDKNYPYYAWDNEFGNKTFHLNNFQCSKYLVSNKEYLNFIKSNGYKNLGYWSVEGKKWLSFSNYQYPKFWIKKDKSFYLRTMLQEIQMPWDWPVEINYHEAKAFCSWKSEELNLKIRLPSEQEYQVLRGNIDTNQPLWENAPGNINLEKYFSPCPVDTHKFKNNFFDVAGNVWQWCDTPIYGLDGFMPHKAYDDFSLPTFDGVHMMIKGGSWISTGNLAMKDSRYAFRKHFYQHSGFRYVVDSNPIEKISQTRITDSNLSNLIHNHFSNVNDDFFKNTQKMIDQVLKDEHTTALKALDLYCGPGRNSLFLSSLFNKVHALDQSANTLKAISDLKNFGKINYALPLENTLSQFQSFTSQGIQNKTSNIEISQFDPRNLGELDLDYNLVFLMDGLKKTDAPKTLLDLFSQKLPLDSLLVIITDYHFLDHNFSGIKSSDGENLLGVDAIANCLKEKFSLKEKSSLIFKERLDQRRSTHTLKDILIWKKTSI